MVLLLGLLGRTCVFLFGHFLQSLEPLEGEAHHVAVLTPDLEEESLIVVVEQRFFEEPLVVVEAMGPLRDGFVVYLAWLLAHLYRLGTSTSFRLGLLIMDPLRTPQVTTNPYTPYSPKCLEEKFPEVRQEIMDLAHMGGCA